MPEFGMQDELLAMKLPELLKNIGLAVNEANKEAGEFHISEATAEIRIAIHIKKDTKATISGGGELWGVGINASYQSQYGYSAEGSSKIKLKFKAGPKPTPAKSKDENSSK